MEKCVSLLLAGLLCAVGCSSSSSGSGGAAATGGSGGAGGVGGSGGAGGAGGGDPRACATDIDAGEVQMFGEPTPTNTEGLVFDADGTLYVSAKNQSDLDQLLAVTPSGTNASVAEADSIHGLESDPNGILAAGIATENLLLIDPSDGTNEQLADGLGEPNFVVTTPWDTILVSDDRPDVGAILEVTRDGDVSVSSDEVPTPNGLVFSLDGTVLYAAATFQEPGLYRIPVSAENTAGAAEKLVAYGSEMNSLAPDGLAIDSEGNVYVALATGGQIAKVDPEGNSTTLTDGLRGVGPASLAFGQGDFDPCSLYVTSLFSTQLYRVGAGVLGVEK